jgi:hypothetical protein
LKNLRLTLDAGELQLALAYAGSLAHQVTIDPTRPELSDAARELAAAVAQLADETLRVAP